MNNPESQRALIFQGGGSLGAYEAGVFHVLYHWIKSRLEDEKKDENIFDVIAGTSIGAINASIVVNCFLENKYTDEFKSSNNSNKLKYWQGTPERLLDFWKKVSSYSTFFDTYLDYAKLFLDLNRGISEKIFPYFNQYIATGESFRRYYSTKNRILYGEPSVFFPLFFPPLATPLFNKFFDYFFPSAFWYQYSNKPLKDSILEDAKKIIEYNSDIGEEKQKDNSKIDKKREKDPRLLLIAVDIENAKTKTFDSYSSTPIKIDHILASAAVPINYSYVEIDRHKYWDGGILSNTPVRELLSEHSLYWTQKREQEDKEKKEENKILYAEWQEYYDKIQENNIPNLDLCIVNLFPESEVNDKIPSLYDYDLTKEREKDIRFHDETEYDIKLAKSISDYHDFVERMTKLAKEAIEEIKEDKEKVNKLKEFEEIINTQQKTPTREGKKPRFYYDLIGKRFDINEVLKIQREDDAHTISDKIFDFSSQTILNLINEGEKDAIEEIIRYEFEKIDKDSKKIVYDKLNKFFDDIKRENNEYTKEYNENLISFINNKFSEINLLS